MRMRILYAAVEHTPLFFMFLKRILPDRDTRLNETDFFPRYAPVGIVRVLLEISLTLSSL